jgi:hAT family C-terminal dimerisation region
LEEKLLAIEDNKDLACTHNLLRDMLADLEVRWGLPLVYNAETVRGYHQHQVGFPKLVLWAALLDPHTKRLTSKLLTKADLEQAWKDIQAYAVSIAQNETDISTNAMQVANPPGEDKLLGKKRKGAGALKALIDDVDSEDEEEMDADIEVMVASQVSQYCICKGLALTEEKDDVYTSPLAWWKQQAPRCPFVWNVALRVLHIPASSAPSEQVFSTASEIISKKRT